MSENCLKNKVQYFRSNMGLTQIDLASAVNVTRQTIISIEKGNYVPSVLLSIKLARTLNTTVEDLFFEVN